MSLYVGIPNVIELRRNLLECKRKVYLILRDTLKRRREVKGEIDKIEKAHFIVGEIKNILDKLNDILPKIEKEEERKETKREIQKKRKKKEKKKTDVSELERLEEELRKIEEELKKLV